ncbi:MAG: hypothetical protein IPK99_01600 [Flavobacteriales bacterium]|nr:hypothetical protein [Flavobacteriales bacterium]
MPPNGSGLLTYSMELRDGVQHGTVISNEATIYFDTNDPIITPAWSNTVDLLAPVSAVDGLPVFTTDTLFTVSWSGTDDGAGIEYYDIFYTSGR